MESTRIKICGLTNSEDAVAAVAAGADAVGVVFAPSPRQVSIEQAADVLENVPPFVLRVGVFSDASIEEITAAVAVCKLDAVQLCGSESPAFCDSVPSATFKVLHVGTDFGFQSAEPYRDHADALLLDTFVTDKTGGTSQTFDWQTIGDIPGWAPLFVAGGLTPDNVGECIAALRPFAVDVSSGVEASPGVKDHARMAAFCAAVRAADAEAQA
ncbi:MAG: phosphoribosylanthranilate isomerase [Coriobacteriia bacterium]|nr:phosphoribosylanthranilate isomerase [Coriobacteriia bacterium]